MCFITNIPHRHILAQGSFRSLGDICWHFEH
nr:MAG TPA: hypothetical protein [Caudoviricetes sp.]